MADGNPTDPRDNPTAEGHLPVAGEVGGPASYNDPVTQDTTDQDANAPQPESDTAATGSEIPTTGAS